MRHTCVSFPTTVSRLATTDSPAESCRIRLQTDPKDLQIILYIECCSLLFAVIFFASAWGPAFSAFSAFAFSAPRRVGLYFFLFVKF